MNDSRKHRLLECPQFEELRRRNRQLISWVRNQNCTIQNLAILESDHGITSELVKHAKLWPSNNCPEQCCDCTIVFCDGSAYWQDQPTCTIAGAAAITVDESGNVIKVIAA